MARLGDLGRIITGNTPKTSDAKNYEAKDICFVKPSDIDEHELTYIKNSECYIAEYARGKARIVPIGSVLVTCIGIIGKVGINDVECAFNQQINAVIPNTSICNNKYLAYAIQSSKSRLEHIANAPVVPILNKSQFSDIEIPLPSLDEQRKIAAVLDKISDLTVKRRRQLDKLDELVKSRFVEMFGDLRKNPKGWPIKTFDEFAKIDGNITTDYAKYANYPHIGIDSIEKITGELKGYRTVREDGVISGKYVFTPKHIIYSKIRPNLNKVALPDFDGLCSADAYPILPNEKNCERIFLALAMRSEYFLDYILQFSSRTNLPKVNRKDIAGFCLPLPPLELQKQFSAFFYKSDKIKAAIRKNLEKLEMLKKALVQEYFGGLKFSWK